MCAIHHWRLDKCLISRGYVKFSSFWDGVGLDPFSCMEDNSRTILPCVLQPHRGSGQEIHVLSASCSGSNELY